MFITVLQACKIFIKFENRKWAFNFEIIKLVIFSRWHCNNLEVEMPPPEVSYNVPLQVPVGNCTCHQLHVSCCLRVNWKSLRSEDFLLSIQGPWGICLFPWFLSPGVLQWDCVVGCRLLPQSCSCTLFTAQAVCCVVWKIDAQKGYFWCFRKNV